MYHDIHFFADLTSPKALTKKTTTHQTRCEKCAEVLGTHYEENGASWSIFHERLKITTLDKSQNQFGLWCPNCQHTMVCVLTFS